MTSRVLFAIFLGGIVGVLIAFLALGPHQSFYSQKNTPVAIGGPFALVDMSGNQRTEKDFLGKPMLVFFGFTNCPDICPSGLQTLTVTLNHIGESSQKLTTVFVSIDPERDSPEVLTNYLASFHPEIIGLTGNQEQIKNIVKTYRVYTKKILDENEPKRYFFDHSSFFYLMDSEGKYQKHYPSSVQAEILTSELSTYLATLK